MKLQVHVVLLWTNTPEGIETGRNKYKQQQQLTQLCAQLYYTHNLSIPALSDLYGHGAGHHVSGGQVFGVGCIALHEALSLAVDQDPSLTTATLCDQTTGSVDPCKDSQVKKGTRILLSRRYTAQLQTPTPNSCVVVS